MSKINYIPYIVKGDNASNDPAALKLLNDNFKLIQKELERLADQIEKIKAGG